MSSDPPRHKAIPPDAARHGKAVVPGMDIPSPSRYPPLAMARTFAPVDLVTLPRLDANSAVYLARALEAAVEQAKKDGAVLPEAVEAAENDLRKDREALQQAIAAVPAEAEVQKVDREEDASIAALQNLLAAHARLADYTSEGALARTVGDRLFPNNDLSFINLPASDEWAVVESKLAAITREHLEADIIKLGGEPILKHLRKVHKRYGVVTGATKPANAPEAPSIGDCLGAVLDSIRCLVVAVSGSVQRKKPKSRELADQLLKPLTTWTSDTTAPKDAGTTPAPAGEGSGGAAPPAPGGG